MPSAAFEVPCPTVADQQPLAVAGGPLYEAQAGVPVTLDGSGSTGAEGSSLTYRWFFGDGATGEGASPSHTYEAEGNYMVTLIVNDGANDSADEVGPTASRWCS